MYNKLIVLPLFNILVIIYALVPGHDFGVAVILFTVLVRLALWPLVKKQLHQQKAMRELQPEISKIKKKAKGDKQKEAALLMELYKEREINPLGSIGLLIVQIPILLGLFSILRLIVQDGEIVNQSYEFVKNVGYMKEVVANPALFDHTLLGVIDLAQPSLFLAGLAAIGQYLQTKQIAPQRKARRSLRAVLKDASEGKQVDPAEQTAAMTNSMTLFFPVLIFIISTNLQAALPLYWATSSFIALIQQKKVLNQDVEEMEEIAEETANTKKKQRSNKPKQRGRKRRK